MYRKIKIFVLFIVVLCIQNNGLKSQNNFYDSSVIREVRLYFEQSNWDYLMDSLFTVGLQERISARICIDGSCYDSVGVRYKGFSSVNVNFVKNPLNIDLDYIITDQQHMGVNKLKLGNVIHDPSFVREVLAYEIARKYMPASQANYANVYINDTLIGLYSSIETINRPWAERNFGNGNNSFFKGDPAVLEYPLGSNANLQYYDNDTATYYPYYSIESDAGWEDLVHLTDILNNNSDSIETILNVDRTLWMHAFNYAIVNLDSYIAYAQNYYIYKDNYARFNPVLWDMNMSFGSFRSSDASTNAISGLSINKAKNLNPLGLLTYCARPRPLITELLQQSTYKRMFLAHIRTIIQENFQSEWYYQRAQELQSLIDSSVQQDTNRFYSYDQFLMNIDTTVNVSLIYPGLRDLMTARSTYLSNFEGFQGAPVIDSISTDISVPSPGDWVWFNSKITGHDSCFFAYRYNALGPFTKVKMYDDGLHHDGNSGDSIYGVQVQMNSSLFQYYYYAENASSGCFSPVRAEYEYYSLSPLTSGNSVVINELMAKNETYAMDNYYEFDDWIELYNNSSADIDLNGVCLTDNILSLNKWSFPDTNIGANSYLVIWADEQTWQNGLHTNFKIADTGESLYLSYNGMTIIDSVVFGSQTMDWSWGRYPNGTGPFGIMRPSKGAVNNSTSSDNLGENKNHIFIYPNPAKDYFTCRWTTEDKLSIEIYNTQGIIMFSENFSSNNGGEIKINTSEFPRGIYIVKTSKGNNYTVNKIILQ